MMLLTNHVARAALVILAISTLSACGKDQVRPAMIQPIRDPARLAGSIALLEAGKLKKAAKSLEAGLKRDPTDRDMALLLRSINEDPRALLGTESFAYNARADDSYMALAQRFLGDRLKFYALMRYNGKTETSAIIAGEIIRIPGTKPRETASPLAPRETKSRTAAPSKPPLAKERPAENAKPDITRAARLRSAGLSALARGEVAKAVTALRAAAKAAPEDAFIKRDLARAERLLKTVRAKG
jgi:tetratricopeptide (TPR) repeat protein